VAPFDSRWLLHPVHGSPRFPGYCKRRLHRWPTLLPLFCINRARKRKALF
jgi:hypothetical protein